MGMYSQERCITWDLSRGVNRHNDVQNKKKFKNKVLLYRKKYLKTQEEPFLIV